MNIEFEVKTSIHADPATVWTTLSDIGNISDWAAVVTQSESTGTGVGATRRATLADGAKISEEFLVWDAGKRLQYRIKGDLPVDSVLSTWALSKNGHGTNVAYHASFDATEDLAGPVKEKLEGLATFLLMALKLNVETGDVMEMAH